MTRQTYTDTVKVRIYFEGVLFPYAKSVVVTEAEGSVSAQIEVPPSVKLKPEQLVGMMCHIFYANKRVLQYYPDPSTTLPPPEQGWPILFQGECSGEAANTHVQSESLLLNFVSHARHFEQTLLYFYDLSRQNVILDAQQQATFIGAQTIQVDAAGVLSKKTDILNTMARRIGEMDSDTNRNIAFVATALELLRSAGDNHAIFGYFDKKLKLTQRFAAYADKDVKNILQLEQLSHLVEKRAQALPSFASLMQLLEIPTSIMKYNWNQLAQPQLRPGKFPELGQESTVSLANRIRAASKEFSGKLRKALDNDLSPTQFETGLGVIEIPGDYIERVKYTQENNSSQAQLIPLSDFVNEVFLTYKSFLENFTGANQEDVVLTAFKRVIAQYKVPNFGLSEPKKKDRPGEDGIEELSSGESLREPDQEEQETREFLAIDQATLVEQDELNEFTITPNMQFSQPPKCNVFFPASFTGYGMHRNAFQEPTRLYGRVNLTPSSRDSNGTAIEFYIAPHWQAFHHLNEDHLSRFTPAYRQMIQNLPNQAQEGIDGG